MLKAEAHSVAASLLACPFCGKKPLAVIRGSGDLAPNPKAKCQTEDCMGGLLPVICLDVQSQVDAWNTRKEPEGSLRPVE